MAKVTIRAPFYTANKWKGLRDTQKRVFEIIVEHCDTEERELKTRDKKVIKLPPYSCSLSSVDFEDLGGGSPPFQRKILKMFEDLEWIAIHKVSSRLVITINKALCENS